MTAPDWSAWVSAPASSANLGPGFDTMALALELRLRARAQPAEDWSIVSDGQDPGQPACEYITAVAHRALGDSRCFHVEIASDIPRAAGLGSSAALAAAVALAVGRAGGGTLSPSEVFDVVAAAEGHSDNAAATVYGGLVAVASQRVVELPLAPALLPVLGVPNHEVATMAARTALPEQVSHAAAARTTARMAALVEGLRTGDGDVLAAAAGDELHEPYRMELAPLASELMRAGREAGAFHVALSGAGPSVLALVPEPGRQAVSAALAAVLGEKGSVLTPAVATAGAN